MFEANATVEQEDGGKRKRAKMKGKGKKKTKGRENRCTRAHELDKHLKMRDGDGERNGGKRKKEMGKGWKQGKEKLR